MLTERLHQKWIFLDTLNFHRLIIMIYGGRNGHRNVLMESKGHRKNDTKPVNMEPRGNLARYSDGGELASNLLA